MNKLVDLDTALDQIHDGQRLMIGGFAEVGTPFTLIDGLEARGVRELVLIANDCGHPARRGISQLVAAKQIRKSIVTHIGVNPEAGRQVMAKEMELELIPQGTLAERIRCGGAGLGGVLVPTGVGTVVAQGKKAVKAGGREYLLEEPIRADVAILRCTKADKAGNMTFHGTTRNFNTVMATAADTVIVEADEVVEIGALDPDAVLVPGVYVDYVVQAKEGKRFWKRES